MGLDEVLINTIWVSQECSLASVSFFNHWSLYLGLWVSAFLFCMSSVFVCPDEKRSFYHWKFGIYFLWLDCSPMKSFLQCWFHLASCFDFQEKLSSRLKKLWAKFYRVNFMNNESDANKKVGPVTKVKVTKPKTPTIPVWHEFLCHDSKRFARTRIAESNPPFVTRLTARSMMGCLQTNSFLSAAIPACHSKSNILWPLSTSPGNKGSFSGSMLCIPKW